VLGLVQGHPERNTHGPGIVGCGHNREPPAVFANYHQRLSTKRRLRLQPGQELEVRQFQTKDHWSAG
jgi:hypothetical protein